MLRFANLHTTKALIKIDNIVILYRSMLEMGILFINQLDWAIRLNRHKIHCISPCSITELIFVPTSWTVF